MERSRPRHSGGTTMPRWATEVGACLAVCLIAAAIRLPNLQTIPRFTDEVREVAPAVDIAWRGVRPLVHSDAYRGAHWAYLMAGWLRLVGSHPAAPRLFALLVGTLTVGATYLLGRLVAGRWAGMLAGLLLASAFGHVVLLSHVAWANHSTPLWTTLAVACLYLDRRPSGVWLVAAAIAWGLALSSHPSAILPFAGAVAWWLTSSSPRPQLRRPATWLAVAALLAVLSPLLVHNLSHGWPALTEATRPSQPVERHLTLACYATNLAALHRQLGRLAWLGSSAEPDDPATTAHRGTADRLRDWLMVLPGLLLTGALASTLLPHRNRPGKPPVGELRSSGHPPERPDQPPGEEVRSAGRPSGTPGKPPVGELRSSGHPPERPDQPPGEEVRSAGRPSGTPGKPPVGELRSAGHPPERPGQPPAGEVRSAGRPPGRPDGQLLGLAGGMGILVLPAILYSYDNFYDMRYLGFILPVALVALSAALARLLRRQPVAGRLAAAALLALGLVSLASVRAHYGREHAAGRTNQPLLTAADTVARTVVRTGGYALVDKAMRPIKLGGGGDPTGAFQLLLTLQRTPFQLSDVSQMRWFLQADASATFCLIAAQSSLATLGTEFPLTWLHSAAGWGVACRYPPDAAAEAAGLSSRPGTWRTATGQTPGSPATAHAAASPPTGHAPTSPATAHAAASPATGHAPASPATGHAPASPATGHAPTSPATAHAPASPATGHAPTSPATAHAAASPATGHAPTSPAASGPQG